MRVSCDESDPGYANYIPGRYRVEVDGRRLAQCFMADEEVGEAAYTVVDQLGKLVIVGDEMLTATARGRVQIIDMTEPVKAEPPIKIAVAPDVMVRDLR